MTRTAFRCTLAGTVVLLLVSQVAFCQITGKVTDVTVYRGQALVTREVPFDAEAGPQEVVVTELPDGVVGESLYATGGDGLTIRAVRHRMTAVEEEVRPEVRALDEQIKEREADQARIESEVGVLEKREEFLDSLAQFSSVKIQEELRKGTLNHLALQQTAEFMFTQRDEIAEKLLALETETDAVEEAQEVLMRERMTLAGTRAKSLREAVVFLDAAQAGPAQLTLSYLVNGVGWAPAYSARLNDGEDQLALEYHAVVTQMSGEDWPDTRLTLSTSQPNMLAAVPILSPLWLKLVAGAGQVAVDADGADAYNARQRDLTQQIRAGYGKAAQATQSMTGGGMMGGMGMGGIALPAHQAESVEDEAFLGANILAAQLQNLELTAPDEVVRLSRAMGARATEGLVAEYLIPGRISLNSRQDQQMFHIATPELAADFYYTAVPLLTDYVYQAVEATNTSEYPLLPGRYNAYVEGAFAGRGDLALVAQGQKLVVGFGTETQLRASRELQDKKTTIRGGNKVVTYKYRLRVSNFMDTPVKIRLWDRLPEARDEQVNITLADPGTPLSEDPLYVTYHRPRGLLRWDVDVPAKASGANAFSLNYEFQIEFDKNYNIGELPAEATDRMRKDMKMMRGVSMGGMPGMGGAQQ